MTDSNGYVLKTAKVVTTANLFVDSLLSAWTCAYEAYIKTFFIHRKKIKLEVQNVLMNLVPSVKFVFILSNTRTIGSLFKFKDSLPKESRSCVKYKYYNIMLAMRSYVRRVHHTYASYAHVRALGCESTNRSAVVTTFAVFNT